MTEPVTPGGSAPPSPAGEARFRHPVEVRFRDIDRMGHAHHSLALVYFEEARAAYWREVAGQPDEGGVAYIIGEVTVRYHARITYPQTLEVFARVTRLGTKSWDMAYELRTADGELLASGSSVQVMYDYASGASVPVPPDIRRRIAAYERL